jgi:hypothetical protein
MRGRDDEKANNHKRSQEIFSIRVNDIVKATHVEVLKSGVKGQDNATIVGRFASNIFTRNEISHAVTNMGAATLRHG